MIIVYYYRCTWQLLIKKYDDDAFFIDSIALHVCTRPCINGDMINTTDEIYCIYTDNVMEPKEVS